MTAMQQQFTPFSLDNAVPLKVKIEADAPGRVSLVVIEGGPVFGWFDRELAMLEAVNATTPGGTPNVDFEIAAAAGGESKPILRSGGVGFITLLARSDSIGFVLHERVTNR